MTATLAVEPARDAVYLEIPEVRKGEEGAIRSYSVEPEPPGLDAWACRLTRLDTQDTHRVAVDLRGVWRCSCKWSIFKRRNCKHRKAILPLYRLLQSLTPEKAP